MITLYQFPRLWDMPNLSPFCMKLETYLRLMEVPYETVSITNPRKGPKGKVPFIDEDGEKIGDAELIIEHLKTRHGRDPDADLDTRQWAMALAIDRMLTEHLYWAILYARWMEDAHIPVMREAFFGRLPRPARYALPVLIRSKLKKALHTQGLGRHAADEVYALAGRDIDALATLISADGYFLGPEPTSLDASVFAFLANCLYPPLPTPLRDAVQARPNLVEYCQRLAERHFPDFGFSGE